MHETIVYLIRHSEILKEDSEYYLKSLDEKHKDFIRKHVEEEQILDNMLKFLDRQQIGLVGHSNHFSKLHLNQWIEIEKVKEECVNEQIKNEQIILSANGEKKAYELSLIDELKNIDIIYSSNYIRAISTAKYIALRNNLKINVDERLGERKLRRFEFFKRVWEREKEHIYS